MPSSDGESSIIKKGCCEKTLTQQNYQKFSFNKIKKKLRKPKKKFIHQTKRKQTLSAPTAKRKRKLLLLLLLLLSLLY